VLTVLVLGLVTSSWLYLREAEAHQRVVALEREQNRLRQQAEANARKAQTAQANEAVQRQHAEAQAYVANMNLAQQAWEQNNVGLLRELLEETAGNTARGFEWYYCQRQAHLELKTLHGHTDGISSVAFSPDGLWSVTGSYDHTVKIWEAATGKELRTLTGSADQTARVWEAANGKELLTLKGHSAGVECVAVSADGKWIITGSDDRTAKLWESTKSEDPPTLKSRGSEVNCTAYSADHHRVITGSGLFDRF
jgi:WD40 repeat protein